MELGALLKFAQDLGASDVHLEGGLPVCLRVRGELRSSGDPVSAADIAAMAHELISPEDWPEFTERRSFDLSKVVQGVRVRVNALRTLRGIGLAIRLLAPFQASLRKLNLHPDLRKLIEHRSGLILVSGPTGSGKTSTLSALLQEINASAAKHVVTIENPIEYILTPRQAFIRQREVGRDTPSVEQALLDTLREDPDVVMVGEMREPSTMRLTLNAAETGHLVLATVHSASAAEALQRIVASFAPENQPAVNAQLADCLIAVVAQRLVYRADLDLRVPECEILIGTTAVRSMVRQGQFFKLGAMLESGGGEGCWTFGRYREWLDRRKDWSFPSEAADVAVESRPPRPAVEPQVKPRAGPAPRAGPHRDEPENGVLVIQGEDEPEEILRQLRRDEDL